MSKLLILNGSPRKKGTSYSFARTLKILSEAEGHSVNIVHVIDYFDKKKKLSDLAGEIDESDIIAIVSPLYSDTLPYFDIWLFEQLADSYKSKLKKKSMFAIGQCGFPDITRIEPLLDACRLFADETQMNWLGGLAYGGGAIIDGTYIENLGKKGQKITRAFKLALNHIYNNKKIPQEAQELITIKISKFLNRPVAVILNSRSRKLAKEHGNVDYKRKVYLED